MARGKTTKRQLRREEPAPRPIVLPHAVEDAQETPIAEIRTSTATLPKLKKSQQSSSTKNKKQREKALKAAEFAQKLENKAVQREVKRSKKEKAKQIY